jgi:hypothetical protein
MNAPPCGHPFDADPVAGCAFCSIRDIPFHRQRWTTGTVPVSTAAPPCRHLGDPTGELVTCATCAGTVRLKLRACAVFTRCTEGKAVAGVACCVGCPRYEP